MVATFEPDRVVHEPCHLPGPLQPTAFFAHLLCLLFEVACAVGKVDSIKLTIALGEMSKFRPWFPASRQKRPALARLSFRVRFGCFQCPCLIFGIGTLAVDSSFPQACLSSWEQSAQTLVVSLHDLSMATRGQSNDFSQGDTPETSPDTSISEEQK